MPTRAGLMAEVDVGDKVSAEVDVLVIGSGVGGMSAAICAAKAGLKVLIVEKTEYFGGTLAVSGGMPWVPANHLMLQAGIPDSKEAAFDYLRHTVGNCMREEMIDEYLTTAPEMLKFFTDDTEVAFRIRPDMPDYASETPGSTPGGRCLEPTPYDTRKLGKNLQFLRPPRKEITVFGGMMVNAIDIAHLLKARRSVRSFLYAAGIILRYANDKVRYGRGTRVVGGNALAARLLKSVLACGVTLWSKAAAKRLIRKDSQVLGAVIEREGRLVEITAKRGVVLATGGFPQNKEMRSEHIPFAEQHVSLAPNGNVGEGLKLALEVGAVFDCGNVGNAFLTPVSVMKTPTGETLTFPHLVSDRSKPGIIAVGRNARRFGNEAASYHDFVEAMRQNGGIGIPAYLICDRKFIDKYGLGLVRPAPFPRGRFLKTGYLVKADTIEGLGQSLGLDGPTLRATLDRYNSDARKGVDTEFGKGSTAYNRYMGDAAHRPNPCLAPIDTAPFYAIRLQTGDIGTALGLRVNPKAQALDAKDRPIEGLYVCGNDMNSVMAGTYATGGITIGPAMTFAYIAAQDILARSRAAAERLDTAAAQQLETATGVR